MLKRVKKLAGIFLNPQYAQGLLYGVVSAVEHEPVLRQIDCRTVVDVGANRGQFTLMIRKCFPDVAIYSFEPLPKPAARFRRLFSGDELVKLFEVAVGPKNETATIHVSRRDDSSSLMAITALQEQVFPGTEEVSRQTVRVGPLSQFVSSQDLQSPALLKVDVQGYELQTLKGCEELLGHFAYIYVECSFVELYEGQENANDVITFLQNRGFVLKGIYNMIYDRSGNAVQGDFLFAR